MLRMRLAVFSLCWLNCLTNVYSFNPHWAAGYHQFPQNAPGYYNPYPTGYNQPIIPQGVYNGNNPFLADGREKYSSGYYLKPPFRAPAAFPQNAYGPNPNSHKISRPQYNPSYPANIWRPLSSRGLNNSSLPGGVTTMAAIANSNAISYGNGDAIATSTATAIDNGPAAPAMPCGNGRALTWVPASKGAIPPCAVLGGYDVGGPSNKIYVCRAEHQGEILPGKGVPPYHCCFVPSAGLEHKKENYEVLTNPQNIKLEWKSASGGKVPPGAVPGSKTRKGEILYIGRHLHGGTLTTGKVQPSLGCLLLSYNCKEHRYNDYEVLVSP